MGYIIKRLTCRTRSWKIQFQTYKGGRSVRDIQKSDYQRLGLHSGMDYEAAHETCKKLNSQAALKAIEAKRTAISSRLKEEELVLNSFLPTALVADFEKTLHSDKELSHWRCARRLMKAIKLDPSDWCYYKERWYRIFSDRKYSYSYVQKLIFVLNKWGHHVAYHHKTYFKGIPFPRGVDKQRIIDAYEGEEKTKASDALSPNQLEIVQLSPETLNWLHLAVWLGLRPMEVDSLLKPSGPRTWKLEKGVLWVYQSKLSGVSAKERWKPIPLKYDEQLKCIEIINFGNFKRPLNKTLKKYFGGQTTCYAGRKGFTDLMLERGNSIEAISMWLGHKSLDRTWNTYKDKKKVLLS